MKGILLSNCRVLSSEELFDPGWIKIERGEIVDLGEGQVKGGIDGRGYYLLPGLVEFHCGAFQGSLCPRAGTRIPTRTAKACHGTFCLTVGLTTLLNTVSLSDIAVWTEPDGTVSEECQAVCQELPESRDGPNQFIHLRCDLAWSEIVGKTISFLSEYTPSVISFIRFCPGAGRFRDEKVFETYIRQRWRGNILELVGPCLANRNPGLDKMWGRARDIISSVTINNVVFCIHDPSEVSDILTAAKYKIRVGEFPVNRESVAEAKRQGMLVCMGAPNVLRGGSQYGNLSTREVWESGELDILTSDYYPASLLEAIFLLARDKNGGLSLAKLAKAVRSATETPAEVLGFKGKGRIQPGNDADLILVSVNEAGQPAVEMTIVGGGIRYCRHPEFFFA